MKIFDTHLSKKIEFTPLVDGEISMYVCGPTVYDLAHLGHGRSAVSFDVMRRYFLFKGFEVKFVSNYTDIDDKMINRANDESITVPELANKIIPEYAEDYGKLGVMIPTVQPKATDYIEGMIDIISKLEERGHVYSLDDGVYFDVSSYEKYGEFSGQNLDELQMGSRVDVKDSKRNPQDFVLWKFKKDGEPFWPSPWGDGRPGWHIECSAMSFAELGEKFDIHGGGLDLKFPHHECEVAQSCAVFGEDSFAQHWMHNGFIQIDNEKMSKSLGNFFTLREIFQKYDPRVVRFMFLQTHYRNPVNFSDVLLDQAKAGLERIHNFYRYYADLDLSTLPDGNGDGLWGKECLESFADSMDNDFDTSGGLGAVFHMISSINSMSTLGTLTSDQVQSALEAISAVDKVFAVLIPENETIDDEIEALIKEREEARANKDWAKSDSIRDDLKSRGIELDDTPNGTLWKRV
ncbi:cysteine--tRNA ligase [Candidatus Peregrinibacteria bacterium CG10_big_fil_rev_8_21_14_0_10_36_19]|nr:MAG: cysteine--tRNA ligase [Candidatus Peregrinibacteria bacterium CG10_big_fil_rev_8_21_14_0_10_36_19]